MDRLIATGIVYDAFGRTTTQASGATVGNYANDLVRQQTAGTSRQTWSLDAAGRLASWTTETGDSGTWSPTGAKTNHYGNGRRQPRLDQGGYRRHHHPQRPRHRRHHGSYHHWHRRRHLAARRHPRQQRSRETATGAILMGVRLYDSVVVRFLSVDPVYGGNANAYI
ncbi:hypothetical protein J7E88_29960 [Streptomyces sp. ISL-10]|uniref:hypothetical protein n=1 Tax=Streptomyces sp. ISL-10 TaxID=2819172 RepID=UPI001BEBCC66|nr:hypothetical protein [Streptomyces sp. ISL-10]MBT2369398.1 hypothetical protein [Streptomyces sp. ISL-10]